MEKEDQVRQPDDVSQMLSGGFIRLRAFVRRAFPFLATIAAVLIGILAYRALFHEPDPLGVDQIDERVVQVMSSATAPPPTAAQVYDFILPSLVYIRTDTGDSTRGDRGSVGSGVIVNADGLILTSLHVVSDADAIEVYFADGSQTHAVMIISEPDNDIAVLEPDQLPGVVVPAVLGNPGAMRVGDEAFAVGNPLGLVWSLSAGVISGFNRSVPLEKDGLRLEGLIQFDAAVNPGNSGGPLLNRQGQVIGIVTALANPSEQNFFTGIGFAVPIPVAANAAGRFEY